MTKNINTIFGRIGMIITGLTIVLYVIQLSGYPIIQLLSYSDTTALILRDLLLFYIVVTVGFYKMFFNDNFVIKTSSVFLMATTHLSIVPFYLSANSTSESNFIISVAILVLASVLSIATTISRSFQYKKTFIKSAMALVGYSAAFITGILINMPATPEPWLYCSIVISCLSALVYVDIVDNKKKVSVIHNSVWQAHVAMFAILTVTYYGLTLFIPNPLYLFVFFVTVVPVLGQPFYTTIYKIFSDKEAVVEKVKN